MYSYNPYSPTRTPTSPAPRPVPTGTGYDGLATQSWTPKPGVPGTAGNIGVTPSSMFPNGIPDYVLHDSNPSRYPKPVASPAPKLSAPDSRMGFPAMSGAQQAVGGGLGGGGGYILGSSVGPPSGYGAGLAPAAGLGGGLYPSLVSLYR